MNFPNFILLTSLLSSLSHGAEKPSLSKKALDKVGSVAKTGSYALATGASGALTLIPVGLAGFIVYQAMQGRLLTYGNNTLNFSSSGASQSSPVLGDQPGFVFEEYEAGDVEEKAGFGLRFLTTLSVPASSTYAMYRLTRYFAQRTKEAAQELKASKKA
jgi:hypothetical protein